VKEFLEGVEVPIAVKGEGHPEALTRRRSIEPLDVRSADAVQVVDPDGGIDDHPAVSGRSLRGQDGSCTGRRSISPFPAGACGGPLVHVDTDTERRRLSPWLTAGNPRYGPCNAAALATG
jgi:hypothetical protein